MAQFCENESNQSKYHQIQQTHHAITLDTSIEVHIGISVVLQLRLQLAHSQRLHSSERGNGERHGSPQTRRAHNYTSKQPRSPTQLGDDVAPLARRHALDGLQSVDDERRQQQHYDSLSLSSPTRRRQNDARQRRQVHSLRSGLLAHAQRIALLVRHRDSRARLLETHQVHVGGTSARHGEPRNAPPHLATSLLPASATPTDTIVAEQYAFRISALFDSVDVLRLQ
mgnify:CR=1 FL=1